MNVDPGSSLKVTADYRNMDVRNLSPSAEGAFSVKSSQDLEIRKISMSDSITGLAFC